MVIINCEKYYKVRQSYCKVWQILQSVIEIISNVTCMAKYDKKLLQSAAGVTKCDNYDKVRHNSDVIG